MTSETQKEKWSALKGRGEAGGLKPGDLVPMLPEPQSEDEIVARWTDYAAEPLASIVCHTFNHGGFIQDALKSFLMQQTNFPFEIIVHDDASTDNTVEIVKDYASRYPAIVKPILQPENIYQKGFRPLMFSLPAAKGEYIAFCEGDDYWIDPQKLAVQVEFLIKNKKYSLCYTDSVPFHNGVVIDQDFGGARRDLTELELQRSPAIFTLTTCFRNVLDNPPETALVKYGDLFLWSRLGDFGQGKYLREIKPSMYRVHSGGLHSTADRATQIDMAIQTYSAMASYYKRLGKSDLSEYFNRKLCGSAVARMDIDMRLIPVMKVVSKILRYARRLRNSL